MTSTYYQQQWEKIKDQPDNHKALDLLAGCIAYSFLDDYLQNCDYKKEYIRLLCTMTAHSSDPQRSGPAARALFSIIVERLCDDFEELQTLTYNKVMTQVISFCRQLPEGRELDRCLTNFKINSPEDLLTRIEKIRMEYHPFPEPGCVKKILLLSRVTIGADIAVTSVIIQRLFQIFPDAEIILIGAGKLEELYAGNPRIKIHPVSYSRRGGLLERLAVWHTVLEVIASERDAKTILVDPDSRLSQLGILPLIESENYFFFDSRSDISFYSNLSMAQLANAWIDKLMGNKISNKIFCYPKIWPPQTLTLAANQFCSQIMSRRIITVNFGVGGNERKCIGSQAEEMILLDILKDEGTVIILDKGFGDLELRHNDRLMEAVQARGHTVINACIGSGLLEPFTQGLIGVESRIGEMAGLIANSHEYIGYDSACQHIAAAMETPCITIFAGSNNMRFIRRWSAHGIRKSAIIHIDTLNDCALIDAEGIVVRLRNARQLLKRS